MPQFIIPPLIKVALGVIGASAVIHWAVSEMRRINEEIEAVKAGSAAFDRAAREALPTLRRDPRTGDWRVS